MKQNDKREWFVYLLQCSDDSLYCGVTKDVIKRLNTHNEGKGAKYTRGRLPVELAGFRGPMSKSAAYSLETQIKKLTRSKKIQFMAFGQIIF